MPQYSLLTEPWIDVVTLKGESAAVGLIDLFKNAHTYERFDFSMLGFDLAVLRFLVALVYIVEPPQTYEEWEEMYERGEFTESFVEGLMKYEERLDLFHDKYPFMQETELVDASEKDRDSSAKLSRKMPTEKGHLLFQHIKRDEIVICRKCITPLLLFENLFASAGGRGYNPSLNGQAPYYITISGSSIFSEIVLNVSCLEVMEDFVNTKERVKLWPNEFSGEVQATDINIQEGLLWKSRQIKVFPKEAARDACCALCAKEDAYTISHIVMKSQKAFLKKGDLWYDPFTTIYFTPESGKNHKRPNNYRTSIWKDYTGLLFENVVHEKKYQSKPPLVVQHLNTLGVAKPYINVYSYYGSQATVYQIIKDQYIYNPNYNEEDINLINYIVGITEKGERALLKSFLKINYMKNEEQNENQRFIKLGNKNETLDAIVDASLKSTDPMKENPQKKKMKGKCRKISDDYWHGLNELFCDVLNDLNDKQDIIVLKRKWNRYLLKYIRNSFGEMVKVMFGKSNYMRFIVEGSVIIDRFLYNNLKDKEVKESVTKE